MKTVQVVLLLTVSFTNFDCSRILGIIPTPSYSHQVVFHSLWKELSLRGHQVTVLTTDPINDPSLTNLTEIDLHFSYTMWEPMVAKFKESISGGIEAFFNGMIDITEAQLQHPQVQDILNNDTIQFDVLLTEQFFPTMFGFSKKFNCPTIGILSLEASFYTYRLMGSPAHPVLHPDPELPFSGKLSFEERLMSTLYFISAPFYFEIFMPSIRESAKKYFGIKNLDVAEAMESIDMLFVNTNPIIHTVRPLTPTVIEIGGGMHIQPSKALPMDLQMYLDKANNGFIYFSLGTNAKSKDLSESILKIFLQTFSKLPYKVLWKFEAEGLTGIPNNVIIRKWFPQHDILRHSNIKLLIYQGGLQSTEEAILSNVPILGIPMFGDQFVNVKLMVSKGLGLSLDYGTLTQESFESAIIEVINNPKYRNRVKELANLMMDQPMTGLEKAIWWTEYVIRHKGAKHLRSAAMDIPFYQYYFLDVIGFCILIAVVAFISILYSCKVALKILFYLIKKLKVKVD